MLRNYWLIAVGFLETRIGDGGSKIQHRGSSEKNQNQVNL